MEAGLSLIVTKDAKAIIPSRNEILYMLTLPALDDLFNTGKIKEWIFVVDNGPAEQPQSTLRLLNFLNLHKITLVSFAEYHSKRNFVERIHVEENRTLSKHGPFDSRQVQSLASPGKKNTRSILKRCQKIFVSFLHTSFGAKSYL